MKHYTYTYWAVSTWRLLEPLLFNALRLLLLIHIGQPLLHRATSRTATSTRTGAFQWARGQVNIPRTAAPMAGRVSARMLLHLFFWGLCQRQRATRHRNAHPHRRAASPGFFCFLFYLYTRICIMAYYTHNISKA